MSEVCACGHAKVWHKFYETNLSLACTEVRCECIDYQQTYGVSAICGDEWCSNPDPHPMHERPAKDGA